MPESLIVAPTEAASLPQTPQQQKKSLAAVRGHLTQATEILAGMIDERGCLHEDRVDISTMGGGMRKYYCVDCEEWIEEEWDDDVEI